MLGCFLKRVPAGKCRECLDGPHYRHGTNREAEMCPHERSVDRANGVFLTHLPPSERSVDRANGLFPAHLPRPDMSLLRQRLKVPGARIPEIHSGFSTYNVMITSKLSDLSVPQHLWFYITMSRAVVKTL